MSPSPRPPAPLPSPPLPNAARFTELSAAWAHQQRSANTRAAYAADLGAFGAWCSAEGGDPLAADADAVTRYHEAGSAAGASGATLARRLSALSSFFAHAVQAGELAVNPVAGLARPPAARGPASDLTANEVEALIEAGRRQGVRAEALLGLLLFDGVKLAEVLAADADDLEPDHDGLALSVLRRGNPDRLPLDPRTAGAVTAYLAGRRRGPLLLAESPNRAPSRLTRFGADYLLKKLSEGAGLGRAVSANTLRRSFVTSRHEEGGSIESIRDRLGHRDVRTTRRLTEMPGDRGEGGDETVRGAS